MLVNTILTLCNTLFPIPAIPACRPLMALESHVGALQVPVGGTW